MFICNKESTHLGKRLSTIRKNTSSATSSIAAVDVNSINVTPTTSTNKEFTSDDYSTTIVPTLSSKSDAVTSTPKQEDLVLGLLKQIIRKHNITQATLLQLVNDVNDLKTNENDDECLLQLEQYLEDEKQMNDTIQELSRIGHNGQDSVKRVMSKVLSNELASQYSWLGLKKKIFSKLLFCQTASMAITVLQVPVNQSKEGLPKHRIMKIFGGNLLLYLKSVRFLDKRTNKPITVPSIVNLIKTLEGFLYLKNIIVNSGRAKYLFPRAFNQDYLENFFASLRTHGRYNSPDVAHFTTCFKSLIVDNFISRHSPSPNCEEDLSCGTLDNLRLFLTEKGVEGTR
ncbi:hypothetical protein FQA39_LY17011 [Lamprigera yunnana]|nr:hypothetical protein FQA39_LY17011 [Lamprigera yunnana]